MTPHETMRDYELDLELETADGEDSPEESLRFLIVDDEPMARHVLIHLLAPFGTCVEAATAKEAVQLFEAALQDGEPFHLICVDLHLPDHIGHDALEVVRGIERAYDISKEEGVKAIIVTGDDSPKHLVRAAHNGCDGILVKPVAKEDLLMLTGRMGIT